MNFLRDKSLKQSGRYLFVLIFLIIIAEFMVIYQAVTNLEHAKQKIDAARKTQLAAQQVSMQVQLVLGGKKELAPAVTSKINVQDHLLKTLLEGGRAEGTSYILEPLSKLPRITFTGLAESWNAYKASALDVMTQSQVSSTPAVESVEGTSLPSVPDTYVKARLRHEGSWLTLATWFDKLILDLEAESADAQRRILYWIIAFMIVNAAALGVAYAGFRRYVLKPLYMVRENTKQQKQTDLPVNNEINEVAQHINSIIENLKDATEFVTTIGKGDLTIDYKTSLDNGYEPGKNKLADSLINMQVKLRELNEEERKRQWANEGLTKFVDILRSSHDNIHLLGDKIISALVQYTKSNQGGLYILNDEDEHNKHLELISLFAFDIKKHQQQKIKPGEGILGQTFLEKETTYLSNLPEEYIRITSGLGDAPPRSVLIVPLKVDQEVYGLVELASFNTFEKHEIEFVERLGETIASTLANVRAAQKNRSLIEQFQVQNEMMRAQEEEMRQNMEELQATQEEIARKEKGYIEKISHLEHALASTVTAAEAARMKEEFLQKEKMQQLRVQALEKQLEEKQKVDDWAVAEELAGTLRISLEALNITKEELQHKA